MPDDAVASALAAVEEALANVAAHPDWQLEPAEALHQLTGGVSFEEQVTWDQIRTLAAVVRALQADNAALREALSQWIQAMGVLSTLSLDVMQPVNPMGQAEDILRYVRMAEAERDALRADLAKMQWHESIGESYRERLVKAEADLALARAVLESVQNSSVHMAWRDNHKVEVMRVDIDRAAWQAWNGRGK